ncbi:invasion associated locus B family protein [Microvirga terrae]|uniref:Invasion associated locus B family protein n=1 Tax=Microvirga terrae TaxID=2740529 RepID=A0ABY5RNN9_9HYPH|nr:MULTISPECIES: invasion associated locus B family protein [Microvirga]MBQ0820742.1 invasion associated locus B family protein [Microvirga sp. HBU67558]UVF17634.1 invasion associated locus B family protein [Microvirga terrae]
MSFATRFASLGGTRGLATALALLVSAPVLAQTAPAQRPAAQPARPAAPAQQPAPGAAAQPQQNAGPTVVQVKAEPSQPEWTKVCGKDQNTSTEICYTTRDFVSDQGQPVLALAVYDVKGQQPQKVVRFVMPLGLLLQPGLRFAVDQGQATPGRYVMCLPNGCFAEAQVKDDFIAAIKKGNALNVSVQNQMGREITFAVPAAGFGKAFDGPPIDPKVLEEQQKKLQEELQKKSEEMRQRMLQGGAAAPGAAPGAAAAGAAAPAAPKP